MVAEHAFIDPRHEDENENMTDCFDADERAGREGKDTKFIGDIMPVEFDPMEVERRIRSEIVKIFAESQNQVKLEMMTSIDALNVKLPLNPLPGVETNVYCFTGLLVCYLCGCCLAVFVLMTSTLSLALHPTFYDLQSLGQTLGFISSTPPRLLASGTS